INPDGTVEKLNDEDPLGQVGEAILYSFTLSVLHFTLDVLVFQQYRQEIEWQEIIFRTLGMAPALFFLIYMMHSDTAARWPGVKQILFLSTSVAAGCYLIYSGNNAGYYAVMKRAPPVGTLWVWSVIEMQLLYAVVSVAIVGVYMWWGGLKPF
ncbi:hypothetical protein LTS18_012831, partial [Coniosporium uncinatum]